MKKTSIFVSCLLLLCVLLNSGCAPARADVEELSKWHFYADATTHPQADESFDAVYVDFTRLMQRDLKQKGTLDENSIRVATLNGDKVGSFVPSRFVKDARYDAARNACGTVIFQVAGAVEPDARQYRIFFDTQANGPKPALQINASVPESANMIWNSGFEILTEDYSGPNRYKNAGTKMPHGWWGNLRHSSGNPATSAHTGKNALALVTPEAGKNSGIFAASSPPALRVRPGENYVFSFWAKGEKLTPSRTILIASAYWYDKDQKYLERVRVDGLPVNLSEFPWVKGEIILPAPSNAYFGALRISTYSPTGLVTVDDLEARLAIPSLLKNAKLNQ